MSGLDRASLASIVLLGALLLFLLVFVAWKMRHHVMCACCLPPTDEIEAQEADSLMLIAQSVHSRNFTAGPASQTPTDAVSRGFDHLPAYIAAKVAAKGRQRLAGSIRKLRQRGYDVEMATQSPRRSPFARQKNSGQWHRFSSEDNSEGLIGSTLSSNGVPQAHSPDHAGPGSISPTLSEQYSIASCSYPPLPWPDLGQPGDSSPLSSSASAQDLVTCAENFGPSNNDRDAVQPTDLLGHPPMP